jgi:hypothetical protein
MSNRQPHLFKRFRIPLSRHQTSGAAYCKVEIAELGQDVDGGQRDLPPLHNAGRNSVTLQKHVTGIIEKGGGINPGR